MKRAQGLRHLISEGSSRHLNVVAGGKQPLSFRKGTWFFISSELELLHLWGLRVTSVKCLGMAEMPSNI